MSTFYELINVGSFHRAKYPSYQAYLAATAARLTEKGYVYATFADALLKREEAFPTGLMTKTIAIAMPHADFAYVKKEAIDITIFEKPVDFKRMDDPRQSVKAEVAFLLLLKEAHAHLQVLQELTSLLQDPALATILTVQNKEELLRWLKERKC